MTRREEQYLGGPGAGRCADAECLEEIERVGVQGLAEAALLASTPQMAANLRTVLNGFHAQKAGPARYCSPRRSIPINSIKRGFKMRVDDVAGKAWQMLLATS